MHIRRIFSILARNGSHSLSAFRKGDEHTSDNRHLPPLGMLTWGTSTAGTSRLVTTNLPHTGRYWCQPLHAIRAAASSPMPPSVEKMNSYMGLFFLTVSHMLSMFLVRSSHLSSSKYKFMYLLPRFAKLVLLHPSNPHTQSVFITRPPEPRPLTNTTSYPIN